MSKHTTSASDTVAAGSSRAQYAVSVVMVLITVLGVIVIPAIAESLIVADGGTTVSFDGRGSFVPAKDWERTSQNERSAIYERAGASVAVQRARPIVDPAESGIDEFRDTLDEIGSWQVGDTVDFVTDSGAPGQALTAHRGDAVWTKYVVTDAGWTMELSAQSPESTWLAVREEIDEMARSIILPEEDPS